MKQPCTTRSTATLEASERLECRAELASLPALLALVAGVCGQGRVGAAVGHDLQLIVEEACVNVMHHAYPAGHAGPLALEVRIVQHPGPRRMVVTLEDQGTPFNPLQLAAADPTATAEARVLGGLGVHLIRQLSDHQHYQHSPSRGNVLTLEKILAPPTHAAPPAQTATPRLP